MATFAIIQRRSEAKNNEVAIVNIDGDIYVKDITNKEVRFVSFNENYPDIVLKDGELGGVAIIGVVIAKSDMNVKIF